MKHRTGINPLLSSWKPCRAGTQSNGLSCTEQVASAPLKPILTESKSLPRLIHILGGFRFYEGILNWGERDCIVVL
jgi:hypothetical protein